MASAAIVEVWLREVTAGDLHICCCGIGIMLAPDRDLLLSSYREYSDHYSYAHCKTQT